MTSAVPFLGQMYGVGVGLSFDLPLVTSLTPNNSLGSGTPTFTRATTASVTDFEGLIKTAPSGCARFTGARFVRNLVATKSEDWSNAAWTKSNMTATATTLEASAANGTCLQTYTGVGNFRLRVQMSRVTGTGNVDLTVDGGSTWTTVTLTGSDQVFSIIQNTVTNPQFGIRVVTSGDKINATKIQLEDVTGQANTNPSEYLSVGVLSAPYHGANVDGVKYFATENGNTVASNVVTEATGAAIAAATLKKYLPEGARTNRCLQSQTFDNATWVKSNITVAANEAVAPDGTTTADTLTASAANGTVIQDLGVVASAAKAGGLWIKRKTGTGNIDLTLDGGSTWTTKAITAAWTRVQIAQTLADEDFGIRIVTSADAVWVWQGQVETAAFLSSDIPTTTAAVVRNADVLTYAFAGNANSSEGTCYAEVTFPFAKNYSMFVATNTAQATGAMLYSNSGGNLLLVDSAAQITATGITMVAGDTVQKIASAWSGTSTPNFARNGTVGAGNAAFSGDIGSTVLTIGTRSAANDESTFGNVGNVKIYNRALSDARLQAMTS